MSTLASTPVLEARGITKAYGSFIAVQDVSLALYPNQIKAVIGPNGAGKSTFFSCIAGTAKPTSGSVILHEQDVTNLAVSRRVQQGLVKSFQTTSIFPEMTVEENIRAAVASVSNWHLRDVMFPAEDRADINDRTAAVIDDVGLHARRNVIAATLSHGEQRRLEVGLALACNARVLLLDEPTAGMSVDDIPAMIEFIGKLREKCSVLLVEHNMSIILSLSDRITVLAQGRMIAEGSADEIRQDPAVRAAYLGRKEV